MRGGCGWEYMMSYTLPRVSSLNWKYFREASLMSLYFTSSMMCPKNSVLRICISTPVYQNKHSKTQFVIMFLSARAPVRSGADIIHVSLDSSANLHFELKRQIVIHHPHGPRIWGVEDDRPGSQSMVRTSGWGQSQTQLGQKSCQFFLSEQLTCIIHLYCGSESIFISGS